MQLEELQKTFAERLTGLMQEKDYNITELAVDVGINRRTINGWLLCKRTVQIDSLYKLSDFFGCTTDYLLGKEN